MQNSFFNKSKNQSCKKSYRISLGLVLKLQESSSAREFNDYSLQVYNVHIRHEPKTISFDQTSLLFDSIQLLE